VQSGGPISFLLSGRPTRARALAPAPRSPRAADSPAPPVSDTAAVTVPAHLSALSRAASDRPSVRARGARRPPAPRTGCCRRRPPVGTGPLEPPRAAWHSHARDPLFPPLFPSRPRCRRALSAARFPSAWKSFFSPLSDFSRECSSLPATPRTRTAVSGHRSSPLPREFRPTSAAVRLSPVSSSPSFQSPGFLAISSPPRLSRAAGPPQPRRRPPETPHHRRTPPPDAVGTASPSTRRSGAPLSLPPCPAPSP
jgi:hypothetical protein